MSKIVDRLMKHMSKVIATGEEFLTALEYLTKDEEDAIDEAISAFKRTSIQERSADHMKQDLYKEISRVKIDPKNREDLLKLTHRVDSIANWLKASSKNAIIMFELNYEVPQELWLTFKSITEMILSSSRLLYKMLEKLGVDDGTVLSIRAEIETLESSVDDLYFVGKRAILSNNTMGHQAMFLVKDLLDGLENSSDHCAGAAETLFILIMATR